MTNWDHLSPCIFLIFLSISLGITHYMWETWSRIWRQRGSLAGGSMCLAAILPGTSGSTVSPHPLIQCSPFFGDCGLMVQLSLLYLQECLPFPSLHLSPILWVPINDSIPHHSILCIEVALAYSAWYSAFCTGLMQSPGTSEIPFNFRVNLRVYFSEMGFQRGTSSLTTSSHA